MENSVVVVTATHQLGKVTACVRCMFPIQFDGEFAHSVVVVVDSEVIKPVQFGRDEVNGKFSTYVVSNVTKCGCHALSGIPAGLVATCSIIIIG